MERGNERRKISERKYNPAMKDGPLKMQRKLWQWHKEYGARLGVKKTWVQVALGEPPQATVSSSVG